MRRVRWALLLILLVVALSFVAWIWYARAQRDAAVAQARTLSFSEAEGHLKKAFARDPLDIEVLALLARGYVADKRKGEADEFLTRWLEQAPQEADALKLRMELYRELGQFDKALLDVDSLIQIEPGNIAWHRKRAAILFSAGRFADAEKECSLCLKKQPSDRSLLRSLAEIKRVQGRPAEAATILDGILRDSPQDTPTIMARALIYLENEEPEKAIPLFRKVISADSNRQRSGRYYLALALNRVGETAEATKLMEEVHRSQNATVLIGDSEGQPKNIPLQMRNARAQFENKDLTRARKILEDVLVINPNYAPAHLLMADVYETQGQFDLAAEHRRLAKGHP